MKHQYFRRTFDEAKELARLSFRASVANHMTATKIDELAAHALITGGTHGPDWCHLIGLTPTVRDFYEIELYKPSDEKPYIEKSYVRMLVPRDRLVETVHFIWGTSALHLDSGIDGDQKKSITKLIAFKETGFPLLATNRGYNYLPKGIVYWSFTVR
ncbi:hypothetical protein [Thiolinea disciformis]|uniref:hypothetical protein n=1 Tax=Thiolinea disciformis TaxID=125614 RepID=UPI0003829097|nr:hypothetical protein [Thiolinea disciformis]